MHVGRYRKYLSIEVGLEVAAVLVTAILILLPLGMLFYGSFRSAPPGAEGFLTLSNYFTALSISWYWPTLFNSLVVALLSLSIACAFGIPLAWVVTRTNTPLARQMEYSAIIPLLMAPFVGAIAWVLLASPQIGALNIIVFGGRAVLNVYTPIGIGWVMGIYYSPYIFLFVSGALKSMDPSLEEASRIAGASVATTAVRVVLPLIAPAIVSGIILVFVLSVEQFAIPAVLGWPVGFFTLTTRIYTLLALPPINYGLATVLSVALLLLCAGAIFVYRRITTSRSYATVTGKGYQPRIIDLGRWKYVTLAYCLTYIAFVILLPFAIIVLTSFVRLTGRLDRITLANYNYILAGYPIFWKSLQNSLVVSIVGASLAILLSTVISWIVYRTQVTGRGILDYLSTLPIAVPGIVMGVGILWAYISFPWGIYGTIWILMIACISRFISNGVRSTSATLVQIQPELEECSRICGASWMSTLRKITLPLLRPGIISGWVLLFVIFFRELTMVLLLWTSQSITLSVLMFELWTEGSYPRLSALGVVQSLVIFAMIIVFRRFAGGEAEMRV